MSAPRLINPPPTSGGVPVGGSGTVGTLPIWVGASTLGNSAVTQVSGSIFSLTGLVGGTGYSTSPTPVALTGGTGTGATCQVVASSGVVVWVQLLNPGSGYTAGNVLTVSGGGGNATITVLAVVTKNDAAGHLTAQRIGAGTSQPNAGLDSRFGAWIRGWNRIVAQYVNNFVDNSPSTLLVGGTSENIDAQTASTLTSLKSYAMLTTAAGKGVTAFNGEAALQSSTGAISTFVTSVQGAARRGWNTDQNTNVTLRGFSFAAFHQDVPNGPWTTAAIQGGFVAVGALGGGTIGNSTALLARHINGGGVVTTSATLLQLEYFWTDGSIGTAYGIRLPVPTLGTMATPAAYYPIAQEHTEGRNYFRAPTFFGSAVGTARSATNPSVEVEAVAGVSNGDVRLRSASAVFDASNSSTNGVRFFARTTGDLPTTTTQNYYEQGTFTPTLVNFTMNPPAVATGSWVRIGNRVMVTVNFASNGVATFGNLANASISLPLGVGGSAGNFPITNGNGVRCKDDGTALGNGVLAVVAATGVMFMAGAGAVDAIPKIYSCSYTIP